MESKTWLWKKRSPEKATVSNGNLDLSLIDTEEQISFDEKELILQESLNLLNDKLASILKECDAKDELVADYAKETEKAMGGKAKAESEVLRLKEKLNEAFRERKAENERINQLNAALKQSMQQLDLVREEQEKRVYEAVITISKQLELEHREASAGVTSLTAENSHLKMALIEKEMLVRDLSKYKAQTEDELDVLMEKMDSMERENAFIRYEFRMLEKELDACNEERKFSRYSLSASNNQNIESSKKMRKLEQECQRLQGLLHKTRTLNLEPNTGGTVLRNSVMGVLPGNSNKEINMLMARLQDVEEENKVLKEILVQKAGDKNNSISSFFSPSHTDSQLAGRYTFSEDVPSSKASSEAWKDCRNISSRSSASSSLTELDQSKHEDSKNMLVHKMLEVSDMSLMDDFLEMEKLAVLAASAQPISDTSGSPKIGDITSAALATGITPNGTSTGKELVPVGQIEFNNRSEDYQKLDISTPSDWIQRVKDIIMNQNHVSGRSLKELVCDVLISLREKNSLGDGNGGDDASQASHEMDQQKISGVLTWLPQMESQRGSSSDGCLGDEMLVEIHKIPQSNLRRSIHKIMELVRRLDLHYSDKNVASLDMAEREKIATVSHHTSTEGNEVTITFKWRKFEISVAINHFLDICDNMLEGNVNFEKFTEEVASGLGLIMNSCVSIQEASCLKDEHLAERPQHENDKKATLTFELQDSKQNIGSLQAELETFGEINRMIEDQLRNQKSKNQDLTQLTVVMCKLSKALQKLSSIEIELEERRHGCEELEQKCLELQLQLGSIANQETQKDADDPEGGLTQSMSPATTKEREINAASVKLDECQETILELGKRLKALSLSKETDSDPKLNNKFSLLQQMQFEDNTEEENKTKFPAEQHKPPRFHLDKRDTLCAPEMHVAPQAIVLSKKRGGTIPFLKRLLYRRKRRSSRKLSFSLTS